MTNVDGSIGADATVDFINSGTTFPLASTITVPADSMLIVLDKATAIYLEENDSLQARASAAGDLVIHVSYEEIS